MSSPVMTSRDVTRFMGQLQKQAQATNAPKTFRENFVKNAIIETSIPVCGMA